MMARIRFLHCRGAHPILGLGLAVSLCLAARAAQPETARSSGSIAPAAFPSIPTSLAPHGVSGPVWHRQVIDNTSVGADGVRLADANGDGRPDVVTGWEEGGVVRLYLNPGPRAARFPWPRIEVGAVASPEDAVLITLPNGTPAVLSATEGNNRTVYLHQASRNPKGRSDADAWVTRALPPTRNLQQWMYLLPTPGPDGRLLVFTGSKNADAAIGCLSWSRDSLGELPEAWHPLRPAGWIMSLLSLDLDNDGDADVLYSDRKGPHSGVGWLENPGAASEPENVPWPDHLIGAGGREVMFLDAGDLDGDGKLEVVAAVKPRSVWFFQRGSTGGWQTTEMPLPPVCGSAKAVKIVDLDLDGRLDLVFSCEGADGPLPGVIWLRHTDSAWQLRELGGPDGTKFDLVATLDVDADGDPDVITCEERDNLGVVWYENPTR